MIESIFPKGLPENIKNAIANIEKFKKENYVTKLEHIPSELFTQFLESLESNIQDPKKIAKLATPVKGVGITFFTENALNEQDTWRFVGFLCYVKDGDKVEPYVIDHDMLKQIAKNVDEDEEEAHSLLIDRKELDALYITIPSQTVKLS